MKPIIFFDLDATLLNHETAVRGGLAKLAQAFQSEIPWDQDQFFKRWEAVAEKYLPFSFTGKQLSSQDQRRMRMVEIFGAGLSPDEADRRFQVYLEGYNANWTLYPDVKPCLEALGGRGFGMITNGEGTQQRAKLSRLGLDGLFSPLIISMEVGLAKPDKGIFELAAKEAGVPISQCVYVGDRLDTDAIAAAEAGMKGIWLNRPDESKGQGVITIHGLSELPTAIHELG